MLLSIAQASVALHSAFTLFIILFASDVLVLGYLGKFFILRRVDHIRLVLKNVAYLLGPVPAVTVGPAAGSRKTLRTNEAGEAQDAGTELVGLVCISLALEVGRRIRHLHFLADVGIFSLSAGNCHDALEGRKLIENIRTANHCPLLMDRAYEDDATRQLAAGQGFTPIVPPKSNRREPWEYDKELYKRRN